MLRLRKALYETLTMKQVLKADILMGGSIRCAEEFRCERSECWEERSRNPADFSENLAL
jgi:hypothetical protein